MPRDLGRPFTLDGTTRFITPDVHTGALRVWGLRMATCGYKELPLLLAGELHVQARGLARDLGAHVAEYPCLPARCTLCAIGHGPGAHVVTLAELTRFARAYARETGHELDGGRQCKDPAYCYAHHTPRSDTVEVTDVYRFTTRVREVRRSVGELLADAGAEPLVDEQRGGAVVYRVRGALMTTTEAAEALLPACAVADCGLRPPRCPHH